MNIIDLAQNCQKKRNQYNRLKLQCTTNYTIEKVTIMVSRATR